MNNIKIKIADPKYRLAFILVTSLFFMWGLSYGLMDVLNKHFQETLNVTQGQSGLVQAAYFGAYFVIAIPAGLFMEKKGYKSGIVLGLSLYAIGALLFIPATSVGSFYFFLFALFVLALGLGCLETAANPYATALGDPKTAETRLNLSQSFNGLGQFCGPLIGGLLFFKSGEQGLDGNNSGELAVMLTYVFIAVLVFCLILLFAKTKLPDLRSNEQALDAISDNSSLFGHKEFIFGVIAQFFYVAAQVGIGAFFINLMVESWPGSSSQQGAFFLSIAMLSLMLGRFISTGLMTKFSAQKMLLIYAIICSVMMLIAAAGFDYLSVIAVITTFFFISIMFPTIFAMGVKNLGSRTKIGSSYMIMAIVGGAIMPAIMGSIGDKYGTAISFLMPFVCFLVIVVYSLTYTKLKGRR